MSTIDKYYQFFDTLSEQEKNELLNAQIGPIADYAKQQIVLYSNTILTIVIMLAAVLLSVWVYKSSKKLRTKRAIISVTAIIVSVVLAYLVPFIYFYFVFGR